MQKITLISAYVSVVSNPATSCHSPGAEVSSPEITWPEKPNMDNKITDSNRDHMAYLKSFASVRFISISSRNTLQHFACPKSLSGN